MPRFRLATLGALSLATLAACSDGPTQPRTAPEGSPSLAVSGSDDPIVAGDVLVKFKDAASIDEVAKAHGLARGARGFAGKFDVVRTTRGNERAMAARLAADPRVEWAEPNYVRQPLAVNPRMWALFNPGGLNMKFNEKDTNGRYGQPLPATYASVVDADMDADFAVVCQAGSCPDIVVGGIDTGVDPNNPELAGRLIAGGDYISNDGKTPWDVATQGHGTHTGGTVAGANISAVGATGISARVKFWVSRVCGDAGCPTSAIVNALNEAAAFRDANGKPMVALNVSLGGGRESTGEKNAIQALTNNGTLVIVSAGNDGRSTVSCPACDPNAISVAATDWTDARTSYSNYGRGLDISAPGGMCYSNTTEEGCIFSSIVAGYTAAQGYLTYSSTATGDAVYNLSGNLPLAGTNYAYMNGTSMAAPNATSAAAVVAWATGLRGAALRTRLQATADDKGSAGLDTGYGYGRVNLYRAVFNSATGTR